MSTSGRLNPATTAFLLLSLTRRCNMRCPGCFFAMQAADFFAPRDLSLADAATIIDTYASLGIRQIVPNAEGEPLLHHRYQEIVCDIIERLPQTRPWLVSNGLLLHQHAEFIVDNLCELLVSLDGPDATSYADYRGGTVAMFEQVLAGIRQAVARKKQRCAPIKIALNCVVSGDRCELIPPMIRLAEELGVDAIRFSNFHPTGENAAGRRPLQHDDPQVAALMRQVLSRRDYRVSIFLPQLLGLARPPYSCRMLNTIVVGVSGDFAPCCRFAPAPRWGNFFTSPERHNNETLREFRLGLRKARSLEEAPELCRNCGYLSQNRPAFNPRQRKWVMSPNF